MCFSAVFCDKITSRSYKSAFAHCVSCIGFWLMEDCSSKEKKVLYLGFIEYPLAKLSMTAEMNRSNLNVLRPFQHLLSPNP